MLKLKKKDIDALSPSSENKMPPDKVKNLRHNKPLTGVGMYIFLSFFNVV